MSGGMFQDIIGNTTMQPGQAIIRNDTDDGWDARTIPVIGALSQSSPSRSLNSAFIPNASRTMSVRYSVDIAATLSLVTGQSGTVFLEISANGTTGWTEVSRFTNANSGTLTIGLGLTQTVTGNVSGVVPAGWSVRLRTANNTGTPTFTYQSGQEATL